MFWENPPFPRGEYQDASASALDHLLGREYVVEDLNYGASSGAKPHRTGRLVKIRLVKNSAVGNLLPKRLVSFALTALAYGTVVDGYADVTAERGYPVDEWLPAAGVPTANYFYVVVEGPSTVLTDLAGAANNVWTVGDVAVALTGATSGATTSGRVAPQDLTGATAVLGAQLLGKVGRALSAKTTANTNADLLLDVGKW